MGSPPGLLSRRLVADMERLGALLRDARRRADLSQEDVARKVDYAVGAYARLERGETENPEPERLGRLSQLLKVPIADLFRAAGYPMFSPGGPDEQQLAELWARLEPVSRRLIIELLQRMTGGEAAADANAVKVG